MFLSSASRANYAMFRSVRNEQIRDHTQSDTDTMLGELYSPIARMVSHLRGDPRLH